MDLTFIVLFAHSFVEVSRGASPCWFRSRPDCFRPLFSFRVISVLNASCLLADGCWGNGQTPVVYANTISTIKTVVKKASSYGFASQVIVTPVLSETRFVLQFGVL